MKHIETYNESKVSFKIDDKEITFNSNVIKNFVDFDKLTKEIKNMLSDND
jgi:hypothetical protein